MSNELSKQETTEIRDFQNQIFTVYKGGEILPYLLKSGSYLFRSDSYGLEIYRVKHITQNSNGVLNDNNITVCMEVIRSKYEPVGGEKNKSLHEITPYYNITDILDLKLYDDIADKVIKGEFDLSTLGNDQKLSDGTELMSIKSQDYYETMLGTVREKKHQIDIIQGLTMAKINNITNELSQITSDLKKTIKKLNKIVFTLTIYAGISEDVIQIEEGLVSHIDDPIYLQQSMLFMDEEVGDPSNGGISFDNVEEFYEWLRKSNEVRGYKNYELILPYQKCVTLMRVRRKVSERYACSVDMFGNSYGAMMEMKTCMLIRNGQNVYAIHSDMEYSEKLFPDQMELMNIIEKMKKDGGYDQEKAEEQLDNYRNGMVLIQGIFDRTNLLCEMGTRNLLNGKDLNNGKIIYNYDTIKIEQDNYLKRFHNWVSNNKIVEGDLIMFASFNGDSISDRVTKYYGNSYSVPRGPKSGSIVSIEKYEDRLTFLYLPEGEKIYNQKTNRYKERTRNERVRIQSYDKYVNLGMFSHRDYEDLDRLMYDRTYRKSYLWLVPLLEDLKTYIEKTQNEEEPFAELIRKEFPTMSNVDILDYIFWWKTKNKWKRTLSTDDLKALRMIKSRIKKDQRDGETTVYEEFFNKI